MRTTLILLSIFLFRSLVLAQDNNNSGVQNLYRVDFAVPDQPAFKLLGNNPDEIMRPSSINELSIITSQYFSNGSFSLPQNFAVEFNPALLLLNDSLVESGSYLKKGWLYKSGLSIGSRRMEVDNITRYDFSIGIKMNIIDKGNLLYSAEWKKYTRQVFEQDMLERDVQEEFLEYWNNQPGNKEYEFGIFSSLDPKYDEQERKLIKEKYLNWAIKENKIHFTTDLTAQIDAYKEFIKSYKKNNWNKAKLDIAIGNLWTSPDSLSSNLKAKKFGSWLTYAFPLPSNKNWGQMMLGASLVHTYNQDSVLLEDSDKTSFSDFSLSARYYLGRNRIKGFVEGLYSSNELDVTKSMFNLGIEINPIPAVWFIFSTGWESNELKNGDQIKNSNTKFDLRFNIPENFTLF